MPKKHRKPQATFAKPPDTVHPTLLTSTSRNNQSASSRTSTSSAASSQQSSVNDLISHLRRTQVRPNDDGTPNIPRTACTPFQTPRTVHPSLRNILELPETPPPRPRPRISGIGARQLRRTPGPPPPESWMLGSGIGTSCDTARYVKHGTTSTQAGEKEVLIHRLERLPGAAFPRRDGLLHMVLKAMAINWDWHVEYDGVFLAGLPAQIKVLLLSYVAVYYYSRDKGNWLQQGRMQGLRPLFLVSDGSVGGYDDPAVNETDSEVSRLDLGSALGRWLTLKQLTSELVASAKPKSESRKQTRKPQDTVPASWDEEENEHGCNSAQPSFLPKSLNPATRFEKLRSLSLAHPTPPSADWNHLINLLSHLSTITHLSVAYWPIPSLTPSSIYNVTDPSATENNYTEAAIVLRKLSRVTYCLKWLDLEGCADWIRALCWEEVGPDGESYGSTGNVWNGPWRNIESVGLGPGFLPSADVVGATDADGMRVASGGNDHAAVPRSRSLASSVHAPPTRDCWGGGSGSGRGSDDAGLVADHAPWNVNVNMDVESERLKYRQVREVERFRELVENANVVQNHIQRVRRGGRGKWVQFSLGLEGLDHGLLGRFLGRDSRKAIS